MDNFMKDEIRDVSSEASQDFESIVQNMSIAHEMAVDPNFKLKQLSSESVAGQVKRIVHQAFWDVLQENIEKDPPNYEQAIQLLIEIKEVLVSLTFEHNVSIREKINSILDVELIRQQSQHEIVDIFGYARFIMDTMSKICIPARDDDIEELAIVKGGLVPLFREIFRVLDLMKLDMANYKLSLLRPQLLQQSVQYERQKFEQYLNCNPNGLLTTTQWIESGYELSRNELRRKAEESHGNQLDRSDLLGTCSGSNQNEEKSVDLLDVCRHCYVEMMLSEEEYSFPETLLMDIKRLVKLRMTCQDFIKISSILAITLNIIGGENLAVDVEYRRRIKEHVSVLLSDTRDCDQNNLYENISEQVIKETNSFLSIRGLLSLKEDTVMLLKQQILNLSGAENNVKTVIRTRLYNYFLKNVLCEQTTLTRSIPAAFKDIEIELDDFMKKLSTLISHNYAVFKPFYAKIVQNINDKTT